MISASRTGIFLALLLALGSPLAAQDLERGKAVYDQWCVHCHGVDGDGNGAAASRVKPKPRDFTSGKYKIRHTTTGNLPTDDDLERAIRLGLPYTSMPPFPVNRISDPDLDSLVAYIKSFSPDFEDPELADPEIVPIPTPPPYDLEAAQTSGRQVYEETGCARCHGDLGRGDGNSAPTLEDDWGNHIRAADLTQPWTFRGGGTREDIFRTMSTGFNGTPMPGFHGSLPPEQIWAITDYMLALSGGPQEGDIVEASYANLMTAVGTADELDLDRAGELFAEAPEALFPIVGQVIEPGRAFYPSATSMTVQAVFNDREIAFRVRWHDMRAETTGTNAPDLAAPLWDDELAALGLGGPSGGGDEEGGIWGDAEANGDDGGSIWGDAEDTADDGTGDDGGSIWGDAEATGEEGDFWGDDDDGSAADPSGPDYEFSDAVGIQFPQTQPTGIRRPYFLFGDAQNPVELWFRDLGAEQAALYVGRGSQAITLSADAEPPQSVAVYEDGEWSVTFKRDRLSRSGISFEEGTFVPIALTVWDGFNRERGNKRGLTVWRYVYIEPRQTPSPTRPMMRAGLTVLGLELFLVAMVRRRHRRNASA